MTEYTLTFTAPDSSTPVPPVTLPWTTPDEFARAVRLYETFRQALIAAQADRHLRPDLVTVNGEPECEWAVHERDVMHQQVNDARAALGLPPVSLDAVLGVERMAVGHSDYTSKYALYCADLALKETT